MHMAASQQETSEKMELSEQRHAHMHLRLRRQLWEHAPTIAPSEGATAQACCCSESQARLIAGDSDPGHATNMSDSSTYLL